MSGGSILDEISAEIGALSDEDLQKAAAAIMERKAKEKARMTPDRVQKMKDREKKRRQLNSEILKAAKAKGLIPSASADAPAADGAGAEG